MLTESFAQDGSDTEHSLEEVLSSLYSVDIQYNPSPRVLAIHCSHAFLSLVSCQTPS